MRITQSANRMNRFGDGSVELGGRVKAAIISIHT